MLFPQIPENLDALSIEELRSLRTALREAGKAWAALAADEKAELAEKAQAAARAIREIGDLIKSKKALAAAEQTFGEDDEDEDDPVDPPADDPDNDDDPDDSDDDADKEASERKPTNRAPAKTVATEVGAPSAELEVSEVTVKPQSIRAAEGVAGMKPGDEFGSWVEFAAAAFERGKALGQLGGKERYDIGVVEGTFAPDLRLTGNIVEDLALWDAVMNPNGRGVPKELTAQLCGLPTPIYDIGCDNLTNRPVKAHLPTIQAPRARLAVHASPALSDIAETAVGIWTEEMDEPDATDEKGPCATIACTDAETYGIWGVWSCLTVQNMLTLSYPELIAAYLNRLAATHARVGEIQLLDAMASGLSTINLAMLGYGASTTITTQLLQYLALYREAERWGDQMFDIYLPRWVREAIRVDISRRNRRDGTFRLATAADADNVFRDVGFDPVWTLDTAAWMTPPPDLATGGDLSPFPEYVVGLAAPKGKFAVIDKGQLTVGVTGNNIYRDNASNARNNFTYFFENFEGLVDTGCAPAHLIAMPGLCYNGAQIADVAMNCAGEFNADTDYDQDAS